jgi:hypothetical protein
MFVKTNLRREQMYQTKLLAVVATMGLGLAMGACASSEASKSEAAAAPDTTVAETATTETAAAATTKTEEAAATETEEATETKAGEAPTTETEKSYTAKADEVTTTETGESEHLAVVDLKLTGEVKDREPVEPTTSFTKGTKVYSWVRLLVKEPETSVKMKWYHDGTLVHTSDSVKVKKASGWRTWLYKTVDTAGNWKVEVVDIDDKAIHSQDFAVN